MTNAPPDSSRRPAFLAALIIGVAVVLAYANTWGVPFLFDDQGSILENPTIRALSWRAFAPPGGTGVTVEGRPLLNASLALNYAVSGLDVWSYHAANLAIHLGTALLLFGLVRRTLARPLFAGSLAAHATEIALAAALLWALHPLQTESVTYIVQRTESLMGLLYLLTLYAFARGWFGVAIAACALGMATKEVMASAPLLVLLYDRTFVSGSFRAAWERHRNLYLGLAATWLVLGFLVAGAGLRGGTIGRGAGVTSWGYALCQSRAIVHYLRLALWPGGLVFDYGSDFVTLGEVFPFALFDLALVALTIVALRRWPAWGFLGAWFFAILAPTTSVLGGTRQMLAEHRMYLSLAAVAVPAALGLRAWLGRRAWLAWSGLALGLAALTLHRNHDYRSALALYGDTVAKRPGNAYAHNNLGRALLAAGRPAEAVEEFRLAAKDSPARALARSHLAAALAKLGRVDDAIAEAAAAVKLSPDYPEARFNLGTALLRAGRAAEAQAQFEAALRLRPGYAEAECNLGAALAQGGRPAEALPHYETALRLNPGYAEAHYNLGAARHKLGQLPAAVASYEAALRLRPDLADAHTGLANACAEQGRWREALEHFEAAFRADPQRAAARFDLANALCAVGRAAEALPHYEALVRAAPDNADYRSNYGSALFEGANRGDDAIAQFNAALQLRPGSPETHANLGIVLAARGERAAAIRHLEEALRLKPDYAFAREQLAAVRAGRP